ncbi:MAG: hypothetical protein ACT6FG_00460 [Methanosarcinaceae archaeon]
MSADNWSQCPICHNLPEKYRNGIEHMYGVLPLDEFLALKEECERLKKEYTVREDYEFDLGSDGTLSVSYFGKCQTCGAEWEFTKTGIKHTKGDIRK